MTALSAPPPALAPALDHLRRGDRARALAAVEAALDEAPEDPALLGFAGFLSAQMGDPAGAIPHFRRLLAINPEDRPTRINLATALIATGELDEAGRLCAGQDDLKLRRLAAYIHQQQGRLVEAAMGYDGVVAAVPQDFESWNNLGNVRADLGDVMAAIAAFERALELRPDVVPIYLNLSELLAQAEMTDNRQNLMRQAARIVPGDAQVQAELGLAESAARDFPAAERAYRAAIRLSDGFTSAYLELGLLLENLNRVDELGALIDEAEAKGIGDEEMRFLEAWTLRRQGRFEDALPLAELVPATVNPIRREQLLAELYDRLGQPEPAFAAFERMNAASVEARPAPGGPTYRETIAAAAARTTVEWVSSWTKIDVDPTPPSPIFIVGFPRSGTTLLDTLLMNLPGLHILEEMPVLAAVEAALGPDADLGRMSSEEARLIRAYYFETLDRLAPPEPGQAVVDKHPLHMARMPLASRIFPDAKIIFVERHPCDAVLSCFMSNFQLNHAMRSFTDIEEAARTYDVVFDAWQRAERLLPLHVHRVRYERMVADLETEMRGLLAFLGIAWDDKVLDNRASAARRGHIRTASYAQVTEPIYRRSSGRWTRYRAQMAPVLPILAPWAERMGYEI